MVRYGLAHGSLWFGPWFAMVWPMIRYGLPPPCRIYTVPEQRGAFASNARFGSGEVPMVRYGLAHGSLWFGPWFATVWPMVCCGLAHDLAYGLAHGSLWLGPWIVMVWPMVRYGLAHGSLWFGP